MSFLDSLPTPSERRIALRLTKDAQRQLRGGHPWIYDSSIRSASQDGAPGDLAVMFDDDRRFLAVGLYDPDSPIRVRVLHHGAPRAIDAAFFRERLATAIERRAELAGSPDTDAYRVVHGENDALPGLVLDRYASTFVLKLDTAAWFAHLAVVVPLVEELTGATSVVLRLSRSAREEASLLGLEDGMLLAGVAPPSPVPFLENGLHFDADVAHGQKTGHFLDQRDNRARVRDLARGARVLDMFCCSGGFTVHAAAGGARSVHSVDLSPHAIEAVRRNVRANRDRPEVAACTVQGVVGDAFAAMERMRTKGEQFDLVIVDPPSFASKQADVDRACAAYGRLTTLAVALTRRGGVVVQSSCSSRVSAELFHGTVEDAARATGRPLRLIERTGHAVDHPIGFAQGAYLKTLFAAVP